MESPKRQSIKTAVEWLTVDTSMADFKALGDDIQYIQSVASNTTFDSVRGDGLSMVYFAVQNGQNQLCIKGLDVHSDKSEVVHVMDIELHVHNALPPVCHGSKLTPNGVMWLCLFNIDTLVGVDIRAQQVIHTIGNISCPSDLCYSLEDHNHLFVAGGINIPDRFARTSASMGENIRPSIGLIFRVDLSARRAQVVLRSDHLTSLGGMYMAKGRIYFSMMYAIHSIKVSDLDGKNKKCSTDIVWAGEEPGGGNHGRCYLAENLGTWSDDHDQFSVALCRHLEYGSKTLKIAPPGMREHLFGSCACAPPDRRPTHSAVNKAIHSSKEVATTLSGTGADLTFMIYEMSTRKKTYYRFSTAQFPKRLHFNGKATHIQRHAGKIIIVNYTSSYVLLLDESTVMEEASVRSPEKINQDFKSHKERMLSLRSISGDSSRSIISDRSSRRNSNSAEGKFADDMEALHVKEDKKARPPIQHASFIKKTDPVKSETVILDPIIKADRKDSIISTDTDEYVNNLNLSVTTYIDDAMFTENNSSVRVDLDADKHERCSIICGIDLQLNSPFSSSRNSAANDADQRSFSRISRVN